MDAKGELLIAVGGGSVIDAGKAAAGMLDNPGAVLDISKWSAAENRCDGPRCRGSPFPRQPAPAEGTRNAVLDVPDGVKVDLRSQATCCRPSPAYDPELTLSLPPAVTAYTGMDVLTQLIEPFVSNAANPITDGVCREGLRLAARSLATAFHDGTNLAAHRDVRHGALGRQALWPTPSWRGPRTGRRPGRSHGPSPRSHSRPRLLPLVMEANIKALQDHRRNGTWHAMPRLHEPLRQPGGLPARRRGVGPRTAFRAQDSTSATCRPERQHLRNRPSPPPSAGGMKGNPVPLPDSALLQSRTGDLTTRDQSAARLTPLLKPRDPAGIHRGDGPVPLAFWWPHSC